MEFVVPEGAKAPLATITYYYAQRAAKPKMVKGDALALVDGETKITNEKDIALYFAQTLNLPIYPEAARAEIDNIVVQYPHYQQNVLQEYFKFRTYAVGESVTLADIAIWAAFHDNEKVLGDKKFDRLLRFVNTINAVDVVKRYVSSHKPKEEKKVEKKAAEPAEKIVCRFAPEPSGYLHIGHAKAALCAEDYAHSHGGDLILRFDNTNPKNESKEFEEIIVEDLKLLDIKYERVEHTSDYIPKIMEILVDCLKKGIAYIDDQPAEEISKQRSELKPSPNRDNTPEKNLELWEEMQKRTEKGLQCVVRAKISYNSPNGCLRDPVIARHIENGFHPCTGTKYPVFPVYDFACPIVDSFAGVTHAMRSWEYTDRDAQYQWFIKTLGLRKVKIISFSRLNFNHTALGKRHLRRLVAEGMATGWDDPRFPTVRGMRRRGLQPETIKAFCKLQGSSRNINNHDWDKIWSMNKDVVQAKSPRVQSVAEEDHVILNIKGVEAHDLELKLNDKHPELGTKKTPVAPTMWIEQADAQLIKEGDKVTLLKLGNIRIDKITKDGDKVKEVEASFVGDNDFKGTTKINWVVPEKAVKVTLREYNNLLENKTLEEGQDIVDAVCKVPFMDTVLFCEPIIANYKKGDILQLERRADIIVDDAENKIVFLIPTGNNKPLGLPVKIKLFPEAQ